jgi:long-subunit acyl-CoA synthetase (AMP-forming)
MPNLRAIADSRDRAALWIVDAGHKETKLSFAALSARSNQVANFLRAQGLKRGDHLLLLLGNVVPLWETMLAAMKLGVVVIPATTLLTPDELRDRLDRGKARVVVARRIRSRSLQASAATIWCVSWSVRRRSTTAGCRSSRRRARRRPLRLTVRPMPTTRCCSISPRAPRQNQNWCGTASAAIPSARCRRCSGSGCSRATCI